MVASCMLSRPRLCNELAENQHTVGQLTLPRKTKIRHHGLGPRHCVRETAPAVTEQTTFTSISNTTRYSRQEVVTVSTVVNVSLPATSGTDLNEAASLARFGGIFTEPDSLHATSLLQDARPQTFTPSDERQLIGMLTSWVESIHASSFEVDYSDLISCLWCLAERKLRPSDAFLDQALAALHPHVQSFTPHEALSLIIAMDKLLHPPSQSFLAELVCITLPHLQQNSYPAHHLPNVLHAFRSLAHLSSLPGLPESWIDSFMLASQTALPSLSPDQLFTLFTTIIGLNHSPCSEWLSSFEEHTLPHLHSFSGPQLVALLQASASASLTHSKAYLDWLISTLTYKLPTLSPPDSATLLISLATLSIRPSPSKIDPILNSLAPHLPALPPPTLACLAYSLQRLAIRPPTPFLTFLAAAAPAAIPHLATRDLIILITVFASSSHPPGPAFLSAYAAALHPHLPYLPPPQLALVGIALADLSADLPQDWMADYLAALQPHLPALQPATLAAVVHALGLLGYQPYEEWSDSFMAASAASLKGMPPQQLEQCITALAALEVDVKDGWLAHWACSAYLQAAEFEVEEVAGVLKALAVVSVVVEKGSGDPVFKQQLLQQYLGCLLGALARAMQDWEEEQVAAVVGCLQELRAQGRGVALVDSMLAQLRAQGAAVAEG